MQALIELNVHSFDTQLVLLLAAALVEIRIDRLVNVYSYAGRTPVIIVYLATMTGGCLACDEESLEGKFFAPDAIPWEELAFRSTQEALREVLQR